MADRILVVSFVATIVSLAVMALVSGKTPGGFSREAIDAILLSIPVGFVGVQVVVLAWMIASDPKRAFRRVQGVRFRKLFWEGQDLVPVSGNPLMIRVRFRRLAYRNAVLARNPYVSAATLEEIRSAGHAEAVLESMGSPAEKQQVAGYNQGTLDWLSDSWHLASIYSLLLIFFAAAAVVGLSTGRAKGLVGAHRLTILVWSSIILLSTLGVLLRVEIARRVAATNAVVLAAVSTGGLALHLWRPFKDWSIWQFITLSLALWFFAWTFRAAPTRRLCSRWGWLGRFFSRQSNG